jgi:hypothetical protein
VHIIFSVDNEFRSQNFIASLKSPLAKRFTSARQHQSKESGFLFNEPGSSFGDAS